MAGFGQRYKARLEPSESGESLATKTSGQNAALAGYHVRYSGTRRKDGRIEAEEVELGPPAPPDDYKMPHHLEVVRAQDPQTGIDVLEFRQGNKMHGRMKLLAERSVQEYVSHLGDSLIPEGAKGATQPIEFRFFVVEDPEINAASLPDGTLLINTGLLGVLENEAQLAFVLSHEMAHVLQVHYRREIEETRGSRIGLTIAGVAAGAFIGNAGVFMAQIGIASVVNGHQRELENQADRLGLQNVIEHGYDPREAPNFSRIMINRYGDRSTSKLWSNHDSSVIRGSFLTVQLMREYSEGHWDTSEKKHCRLPDHERRPRTRKNRVIHSIPGLDNVFDKGRTPKCWELTAGDGSEDQEGLGSRGDGVGQRGVGLLVRQILAAGEEAQERAALLRDVIADRAAQHRVTGFERVEDGALRELPSDLEFDFAVDVRQSSQMWREDNADHASVWTSTESTGGRSRTIGAQLSPASADA